MSHGVWSAIHPDIRAGCSRGVPYMMCICWLVLVGICKENEFVAAHLPRLSVPWVAGGGVGNTAHLPLLAGMSESAKMATASVSTSKLEGAYKKWWLSLFCPWIQSQQTSAPLADVSRSASDSSWHIIWTLLNLLTFFTEFLGKWFCMQLFKSAILPWHM